MTAYYRPPMRRRPRSFLPALSVRKIFYKCKYCDKLFKTKKGCKIHLVKMHLKDRNNPSYRKKSDLNKHIDRVRI